MNVLEAAKSMSAYNERLRIDTLLVSQSESLAELEYWLKEIQVDIDYLNSLIEDGVTSKNVLNAKFLQCILQQQIRNRIYFFKKKLQKVYHHFKTNYPNEFKQL